MEVVFNKLLKGKYEYNGFSMFSKHQNLRAYIQNLKREKEKFFFKMHKE